MSGYPSHAPGSQAARIAGARPPGLAHVFENMASLAGFSEDDFETLLTNSAELDAGEIGAVLGYLLGRLDARDAAAMATVVRRLQPQHDLSGRAGRPTVNIVGTGGGPGTFNITTTAALVVAAAGVAVVKTGSAACRSKSGFADVASKLGTLKVSMPWERIDEIVDEIGIAFVPPSSHALAVGMLTQNLTQSEYRNAASYLNKIGPLLSPVRVDFRLIGANSATCLEMLAGACRLLGDIPTTLVAADDGLDEVSSMAPTAAAHLTINGRTNEVIDPRALGIDPPALEELRGYEPAAAAECCERILDGHGSTPQTEIVALNAAVVLRGVGKCVDLPSGFQSAMQILRDGEPLRKLRELRERVWKCAKH